MYNKLSHRKHTRGTNVEVLCVCEMQRILFVIRIKLDPLLIQYKPNLKKKSQYSHVLLEIRCL